MNAKSKAMPQNRRARASVIFGCTIAATVVAAESRGQGGDFRDQNVLFELFPGSLTFEASELHMTRRMNLIAERTGPFPSTFILPGPPGGQWFDFSAIAEGGAVVDTVTPSTTTGRVWVRYAFPGPSLEGVIGSSVWCRGLTPGQTLLNDSMFRTSVVDGFNKLTLFGYQSPASFSDSFGTITQRFEFEGQWDLNGTGPGSVTRSFTTPYNIIKDFVYDAARNRTVFEATMDYTSDNRPWLDLAVRLTGSAVPSPASTFLVVAAGLLTPGAIRRRTRSRQ